MRLSPRVWLADPIDGARLASRLSIGVGAIGRPTAGLTACMWSVELGCSAATARGESDSRPDNSSRGTQMPEVDRILQVLAAALRRTRTVATGPAEVPAPTAAQPDSAAASTLVAAAPARDPDPAPPALPTAPEPAAPSKDWAKMATVIVAACALVATSGSCVAAWGAWRTARAAEQLGRQTLQVNGPIVEVDPVTTAFADCRDSNAQFSLYVTANNTGRMAAELKPRSPYVCPRGHGCGIDCHAVLSR